MSYEIEDGAENIPGNEPDSERQVTENKCSTSHYNISEISL